MPQRALLLSPAWIQLDARGSRAVNAQHSGLFKQCSNPAPTSSADPLVRRAHRATSLPLTRLRGVGVR
jgi:hypothetical protein